MRQISIDRTSAELLVELLEDCDPGLHGSWRFELAGQIRQEFGMACCPVGLVLVGCEDPFGEGMIACMLLTVEEARELPRKGRSTS